jgi:methylmalonyl-CoA mutase cobalamin-binding domain/chain
MAKSIPANSEKISFIRNRTAGYSKLQGRRPRILITRFSPNDSERAIKSIATAFADMGFDVDINLSVQEPVALARIAAENDVHAIGIPCISSKSKRFIAELLKFLKTEGGRNILVVAWMSDRSESFNTAFKAGDGKLKIFTSEIGYNNSVSQILDDLERHSFQL